MNASFEQVTIKPEADEKANIGPAVGETALPAVPVQIHEVQVAEQDRHIILGYN